MQTKQGGKSCRFGGFPAEPFGNNLRRKYFRGKGVHFNGESVGIGFLHSSGAPVPSWAMPPSGNQSLIPLALSPSPSCSSCPSHLRPLCFTAKRSNGCWHIVEPRCPTLSHVRAKSAAQQSATWQLTRQPHKGN